MNKEEFIDFINTISEEYYNIKLQNNKVFFNDYTTLTKIISFALSIGFTTVYFFIAKNYFIFNGSTFRNSFTINDVYFTTIIFFVSLLYYCLSNIKKYVILDLNNNCISNEFRFFSIKIKTKTINANNILQIKNSISPTKSRFKTKGYNFFKKLEPVPDTNLFYTYSVDILLNNRDTKSIIIGPYYDDYQTSVEISKKLSEYFNRPLIECKKRNEET